MSRAPERLRECEALFRTGQRDAAAAMLHDMIREHPDWPEALHAMAQMQLGAGQPAAALEWADRAVAAAPDVAVWRITRGAICMQLGWAGEGTEEFRRAVRLAPDNTMASLALAKALGMQGLHRDCVDICRRLWDPRSPVRDLTPVYVNALSQLGDMDALWPVLEAAARHSPDNPELLTALACGANAASSADARSVMSFHEAYGRTLERARPSVAALLPNDKDPDRPLRIAVISSDFTGHNSVSFFMRPWFEHMDQERYTLYAYSVGVENDGTSERFRNRSAHWRHLPRAPDDSLAAQIRADGIDIALELIGHTGRRSMGAFQPRCAPVQVSYLAYSNTTGLRAFDWRIVDNITDPSPAADSFATERLWRLDPCFLCYAPIDALPAVATTPAMRNDEVTFGAFSELLKLNEPTFRLWAEVLRTVPGSRLLLKNRAVGRPDAERHLRQRLESAGIPRGKFSLRPRTARYEDHLNAYAEVDVALDTWPYNGTTTVCESLVMGVPIIGLRPAPEHDRHAARVTMSILTAAGMPELIAADPAEFVRLAASLTEDANALNARRSSTRARFLGSPVCDSARFTRSFESALRGMWMDYCAQAKQ